MKMAQFALMLRDQHFAVGLGFQFAEIGVHATRLKIDERMVMMKKMAMLIQRNRLLQRRSGPIRRTIINAIDIFANASVKKVKDCRTNIHFRNGTMLVMGT
jgi:hypothetical protein